jgi:hypothetical protein
MPKSVSILARATRAALLISPGIGFAPRAAGLLIVLIAAFLGPDVAWAAPQDAARSAVQSAIQSARDDVRRRIFRRRYAAIEYCMRRYRSYDPYSMTYRGYDGLRHRCP